MFRCRLYQFILFFLHRCSPSFCYKLAEIISDAQYFFSWKDRQAVKNNLKEILPPEANLAYYTREVFRNFGRYLVEFFQMDRIVDLAYIKKNIKIENFERIQHVLDKGKGGIVISAHFGNWELGAGVLSVLGHPSAVVALPHKEKFVNDLFNRQRVSKGVSVIPVQKATRQCLEVLRENKLVSIVADRDFNLRGEEMDFLGRKAILPRGAALFSWKTGAPIIPIFLRRNGKAGMSDFKAFTFSIGQPIFPSDFLKESDGGKAVINIMKKYIKVIEIKIRENPSQWLIFREFWVK